MLYPSSSLVYWLELPRIFILFSQIKRQVLREWRVVKSFDNGSASLGMRQRQKTREEQQNGKETMFSRGGVNKV